MLTIHTTHLLIRPFVMSDFDESHRLFDIELAPASSRADDMKTLANRAEWLQWSTLNPTQLAKLNQPPYGDYAIQLKLTGELIGSCGFVPCLAPFEQLPYFAPLVEADAGLKPIPAATCNTPEVGLFFAISPRYQNNGYATEAAQALVEYAFQHLRLKRVVATTEHDNLASIAVMKKLGMQILSNPHPAAHLPPEPPWFQVVGVINNPIP